MGSRSPERENERQEAEGGGKRDASQVLLPLLTVVVMPADTVDATLSFDTELAVVPRRCFRRRVGKFVDMRHQLIERNMHEGRLNEEITMTLVESTAPCA